MKLSKMNEEIIAIKEKNNQEVRNMQFQIKSKDKEIKVHEKN